MIFFKDILGVGISALLWQRYMTFSVMGCYSHATFQLISSNNFEDRSDFANFTHVTSQFISLTYVRQI